MADMSRIRDDLAAIVARTTWIVAHLDRYQRAHRDQLRGGLPSGQAEVHVSGGAGDYTPLRFDKAGNPQGSDAHDEFLHTARKEIAAALSRARNEVEGIERRMRSVTEIAQPVADPEPKGCTNRNCGTVFSMIGNDRPHDFDGRCPKCHQWFRRKGYEWTPRAGTLGEDVIVADGAA